MFKNNTLVIGIAIGIGIGISASLMITPAQQVDYDKLVLMVSKSVVSELKSSASQPPDTLSLRNDFNEQIPSSAENTLLLSELKTLFQGLSKILHDDHLQSLAQSNSTQNQHATNTNSAITKLTHEQQAQQTTVIHQAEGYLDEALSRGTWDDSDVNNLKQLLSTLPVTESIKIRQQLLAAMNDGRIKTELDPMQLFQ